MEKPPSQHSWSLEYDGQVLAWTRSETKEQLLIKIQEHFMMELDVLNQLEDDKYRIVTHSYRKLRK